MWWMWGRDLPSVSDLDVLEFSGQTRVYDRNNALIGTLTPSLSSGKTVNRDLMKLEDISPWLQKAVVTSEDRRFYEHHGVDYIGIARGLLKGLLHNDLEGGSSITQQVVKNTLLDDLQGARTAERKFKEAVLAYQLERRFNKDQILTAYLNVAYWGNGKISDIVGAAGAAQAYFGKSAADLNLAESVYLTTILPAPNSRYKSFKAYRPLMKSLLDRMVEDGRVTQAQADAAWKTPIYPAGWRIGWNDDGTLRSAELERPDRIRENLAALEARRAAGSRYQNLYYLQAVEDELIPKIGRKALFSGGKIYTGMDVGAQQAAEAASLRAELPDGATLGMAFVNPQDGEVLALVGQKLWGGRPAEWNNATQARRQVGSSIKPLLYTLALEKGWKQSDTVLDSPIEGDYQPMNYDGRWTGRYVTMRYALDHSLNLPTVRIAQELGLPTFESKLRQLGLTPPPDAGLSLSIGTLEASPLQMAAAYAPFVNGGLYFEPSFVRRMEDGRGQTLYQRPKPQGQRVWDERVAWLGLDIIRGVVNDLSEEQGGLATRALISGWDVGGKTGTTNDIKDLWFAGVTPNLAGAVWVGKQEGGPLPDWAYSGTVPTPIWQAAVSGTLQGKPRQSFQEPQGIVYRVVRQVNMAFRQEEADQEQVMHDGTSRTQEEQNTPPPESEPISTPQPTEPEPQAPAPAEEVPTTPATEEPTQTEPDPWTTPPEALPTEPEAPLPQDAPTEQAFPEVAPEAEPALPEPEPESLPSESQPPLTDPTTEPAPDDTSSSSDSWGTPVPQSP